MASSRAISPTIVPLPGWSPTTSSPPSTPTRRRSFASLSCPRTAAATTFNPTERWQFPTGAILVKTFLFFDDARPRSWGSSCSRPACSSGRRTGRRPGLPLERGADRGHAHRRWQAPDGVPGDRRGRADGAGLPGAQHQPVQDLPRPGSGHGGPGPADAPDEPRAGLRQGPGQPARGIRPPRSLRRPDPRPFHPGTLSRAG